LAEANRHVVIKETNSPRSAKDGTQHSNGAEKKKDVEEDVKKDKVIETSLDEHVIRTWRGKITHFYYVAGSSNPSLNFVQEC